MELENQKDKPQYWWFNVATPNEIDEEKGYLFTYGPDSSIKRNHIVGEEKFKKGDIAFVCLTRDRVGMYLILECSDVDNKSGNFKIKWRPEKHAPSITAGLDDKSKKIFYYLDLDCAYLKEIKEEMGKDCKFIIGKIVFTLQIGEYRLSDEFVIKFCNTLIKLKACTVFQNSLALLFRVFLTGPLFIIIALIVIYLYKSTGKI